VSTLTVFAATSDGYISSTNATYATARTGGTLAADSVATTCLIGQQFNGSNYIIDEAFFSFDTSPIPTTATVNSVAFSLWGSADNSSQDFTMQARTDSWTAGGLTTADWVSGASLGALTLLATFSTASFSQIGYNQFTENGTNFRSAINKGTGATTQFLVDSDRHVAGNTPTIGAPENVTVDTADASGTANDPQLVIGYTLPPISVSAHIDAAAELGTATLQVTHNVTAHIDASVEVVAAQPQVQHSVTAHIDTAVEVKGTIAWVTKGMSAHIDQSVEIRATLTGWHVGKPIQRSPGNVYEQDQLWFDWLDDNNNVIGQLHPLLSGSIQMGTDQQIARTITGIILPPDEATLFNIYSDRFRPVIAIDGVEYNLGLYIPTSPVIHRADDGPYLELSGMDLGYLLQQTLFTSFYVDKGTNVTAGIIQLLVMAGIHDYNIPDLGILTNSLLGWPPGTPIVTPLKVLLALQNLTGPYIDRNGTLRSILIPYAGTDAPARSLHEGRNSPMSPRPQEVTDLWQKPTDWWVTTNNGGVIAGGTYSLPPNHPLSSQNRNYRVVKTLEVPGLANTDACAARARAEAQMDMTVHAKIDVDVKFDPTREPWDIETYRDTDYILAGYNWNFGIGQDQSITLRESIVGNDG
jgi:hypothetical protein